MVCVKAALGGKFAAYGQTSRRLNSASMKPMNSALDTVVRCCTLSIRRNDCSEPVRHTAERCTRLRESSSGLSSPLRSTGAGDHSKSPSMKLMNSAAATLARLVPVHRKQQLTDFSFASDHSASARGKDGFRGVQSDDGLAKPGRISRFVIFPPKAHAAYPASLDLLGYLHNICQSDFSESPEPAE